MAHNEMDDFTKVMFDALQYFAHSGDASYLLLPQRSFLAIPNAMGDSSMHVAINGGQVQAACTIARLVDKEHLDTYNKEVETPLHLAVRLGQVETVDTLVSLGANVFAVDSKGNTAVHLACKAHDMRLATSVVSAAHDSQMLSQASHEGLCPIHLAAANPNADVLIALMDRGNVSINVTDTATGRTALHVAVRHGHVAHASALLSRGASPDIRDFIGNTALHVAAETGRTEIAMALLEKHADVSVVNRYGQTAMDIARARSSNLFEEVMKVDKLSPLVDNSMAALEADYELLSVDDVATLPSSDWDLSGSGRGSRHTKSKLNKMLKGPRKSMRMPFLASKSRKAEAMASSSAQMEDTLPPSTSTSTSTSPTDAVAEKRALQQRYAPRMDLQVDGPGASNAAEEKERLAREYIATDYSVGNVHASSHASHHNAKAAEVARANAHARGNVMDTDSLAMID